jgi:hypothetical protein
VRVRVRVCLCVCVCAAFQPRARPEVMTVGLKTVRELALRCPHVMQQDLLTDLAQYKKFREKEVRARDAWACMQEAALG